MDLLLHVLRSVFKLLLFMPIIENIYQKVESYFHFMKLSTVFLSKFPFIFKSIISTTAPQRDTENTAPFMT